MRVPIVFVILIILSRTTFASNCDSLISQSSYQDGKFLVGFVPSPIEGELLDPNASSYQVEPWFHPANPLTRHIPLTFMKHKFARAFTFSADGKYVIIHHDISPNAEQLTLRSLQTGENLSSLLWRGKGETLFDLQSVDFDGQSRRIVGLGTNHFTDGSDSIVSWDGRKDSVIENIVIQPPQNHEYFTVVRNGHNHSFRTRISQDQPYYVRTHLRSYDKEQLNKEYSAQIIDWQNKHSLNLTSTAVDYLEVIPEPFSARFRYAATLQDNKQNVQIVSFDEISRRITRALLPAVDTIAPANDSQSGRIFKLLQSFMGITSQKHNLALSGAKTKQPSEVQTLPQFSSVLVHEQPVAKAVLSKWAPFVVTKTESGLHIWNAKTGDKIDTISSPVMDFRVLDKIGLLAYVDKSRNLILYSMLTGNQIAKMPGFTYYYLNSRLDNRATGQAYVTMDNGSVIQVTESFPQDSSQPIFDITDTGLRLNVPQNYSSRTVIETRKGKYLVQIYEFIGEIAKKDTKLMIDVYSLDGSGSKLGILSFPIATFHPQFALDPAGKTVVYTSEDTKTGIVRLEGLLEEHSL